MQKLEELLQIQQQQEVEIGSAKQLAYKDPLTGVKNKRACEDYEAELDAKIKEGLIRDFAVVSLDVNGLKMTNDTYGHKAGDELLISACRIICRHFSHSPVFRFGGDEFEVILQGQDYENRHAIAAAFNREAGRCRNVRAEKRTDAHGCRRAVRSDYKETYRQMS